MVRNIVNLSFFHTEIDALERQKVNYGVKKNFSLAGENGVSDDSGPVQCSEAVKSVQTTRKSPERAGKNWKIVKLRGKVEKSKIEFPPRGKFPPSAK
jgi:hypothetical protein